MMARNIRSLIGLIMALLVVMIAFCGIGWSATSAKATDSPGGYYAYSVKFVCGAQTSNEPEVSVTRPGTYATEINTHNPTLQEAQIEKFVIPLVANQEPVGREPNISKPEAKDSILLPRDTATMDDCARIWKLLKATPGTFYVGFLEIQSPVELSVEAVYTAQGFCPTDCNIDIDVEHVEGTFVTF